MKGLRGRLTYANVVSTACLFLLLGGGAYAATQLPPNSVGTRQLRNSAVTKAKISGSAKNALRGEVGPTGPTGPTGPARPPEPPPVEQPSLPAVLASGAVERGEFTAMNSWSSPASAGLLSAVGPIDLPVPLEAAPTPHYLGAGAPPTGECPGSASAPDAASGQLCVYETFSPSSEFISFFDVVSGTTGATRFGTSMVFHNDALTNLVQAYGTWAVRAP
jgi:hypothetical protein